MLGFWLWTTDRTSGSCARATRVRRRQRLPRSRSRRWLAACGERQLQLARLRDRRHSAGAARPRRLDTPAVSQPTVFAAASLTKVFPEIDPSAKYTFGGSGALETQIEQGAPADVFAAASPKQPAALFAKGLVDKPVEFATNTLVLIVPKSNPAHITSVGDITKPGVKLVICNATVPVRRLRPHRVHEPRDHQRRDEERRQPDDRRDPDGGARSRSVRPTPASSTSPTPKPPKGKVAVVRLPAQAKPGAKDFIAVVKCGQEPGRGTGVRAAGALAPGPGEAAGRWVRQAVSTAARSGSTAVGRAAVDGGARTGARWHSARRS